MPITRNIQASVIWCLPYLGYQPVQITGDDPALTAANLTKGAMLGAPFTWPFNTSELMVELTQGIQDYLIDIPRFGYLSKGTVDDPTNAGASELKEIPVKRALSFERKQQRPGSIAAQQTYDDGSVQIRFNTPPATAMTAYLQVQHAAPSATSLAATWAPFPDSYSYIYDWGFLSILALLLKDARYPIFRQTFTAHLLGAQEGLEEVERSIFLGNWLEIEKQVQRASQKTQQGTSARQL